MVVFLGFCQKEMTVQRAAAAALTGFPVRGFRPARKALVSRRSRPMRL